MNSSTPTMESVRRTRQKIQEKGYCIGKLRAQRLEEAEEVRKGIKDL